MQRFTRPTGRGTHHSDVPDRYGFTTESRSTIPPRPHLRINVSSTGQVRQDPLPSMWTPPHSDVVTIDSLTRALTSPWMTKYGRLRDDLLAALRDETPPVQIQIPVRIPGSITDPGTRAHQDETQRFVDLDVVVTESMIGLSSWSICLGHPLNRADIDATSVTMSMYRPDGSSLGDFIGYAYADVGFDEDSNQVRLDITAIHASNDEAMAIASIPVGTWLRGMIGLKPA